MHDVDTTDASVFFAFPDGVLDYTCGECEKYCCRDVGMGIDLRQAGKRVLELYPALASSACGVSGSVLAFSTPKRCYLLDDDGLCRVENEHGRGSKPDVCRLFPFVPLYACGNSIVVAPNFLCDIRIRLNPHAAANGAHTRVLEALREAGVIGQQRSARLWTHAIGIDHAADTHESFLTRLHDLLHTCCDGLGNRTFMGSMRELTEDCGRLESFLERACAVLGIAAEQSTESPDHLDAQLHVMAPSLALLMPVMQLDGWIRAFALGEVLVRRLASLRARPGTLKQIHQVLRDLGPGIRLLARFDRPMIVPAAPDDEVAIPAGITYGPLVLAAYAIVAHARQGRSTLGCIERALDARFDAAMRSAFLVEFGLWIERQEALTRRRPPDGAGSVGTPDRMPKKVCL